MGKIMTAPRMRHTERRGPNVIDAVLSALPAAAPGKALAELMDSGLAGYAETTVKNALRDLIDEGVVASTRAPGRPLYHRITT
jgi:hypothetical protein